MLELTTLAPEAGADILLSRLYDAEREEVWAALTDAEALSAWWPPDGCSITTHEADIRPGGVWAFTLTTPEGESFEYRHKYEDLTRPERIIYRQGERPGDDNAVIVTITLAAHGMATLVTLRIEFSSPAWRAKLIPMGAIRYPGESLEHLATYLKREQKAGRSQRTDKGKAAMSHGIEHSETLPELVAIREFDAPRELVFAAWTDPRHFPNWFCPVGFETVLCEMDVREGGFYRIHWRDKKGNVYPNKAVYHEVSPPDRLVYADTWDDDRPDNEEIIGTILFEDIGGGRTRMTSRSLFKNHDHLERIKAMGVEAGWAMFLDRLDTYLAGLAKG